MDASTLFRGEEFKGSNLYTRPPERSTLQLSTNNTALMDMLYGILGRDGPISPTFPTPVRRDSSEAKVIQWANSLDKYQSPVDKPPSPVYTEYYNSPPRNTPSPLGSMLSDSSSHDSSSGPRTPTFSNPVPAVVGREFSLEKETNIPETPIRPPPEPPVHSIPPRYSNHNGSKPPPSPDLVMQATITSLVDDFMPQFIPSPIETKPTKPSNLRISTQGLAYPVTPISKFPELELAPPLLPSLPLFQAAEPVFPQSINSPTPVRSLESDTERSKKLLKELEGHYSPYRRSMEISPNKLIPSREPPLAPVREWMPPSPSKTIRLEERPRALSRPPVLSIVIEERPNIPVVKTSVQSAADKTFDSRDRYRRRSSITPSPITKDWITEDHPQIQARHSVVPPASKAIQIEQQKPATIRHSLPAPVRSIKEETAAIPILVPALAKSEQQANFATNSGLWLKSGLFAGEQGMQFTMSRRVTTMSKLEWVVEGADGSRLLKCHQQTNSLSRRKDFFDLDGNRLFDFQRRTGSTRTAESPEGATLFVIKNASLHTSPHWIVSLTSTSNNAAVQWVAEGDEAMENVVVTWGGFQVGRISCVSRLKRHTYTVSISSEMNYCIMAALTTVFDDLRTDEGC